MKHLKIILSVFLVFIISFTTIGCSKLTATPLTAKAYLEKRYDDEFTYYRTIGGKSFLENDKNLDIVFTSSKYPDSYVTVSYSIERKAVGDNYLYIKYARQFDNLIDGIISNAFPRSDYYFFPVDRNSTWEGFVDCAPDTSFEEFRAIYGGNGIYAYINVPNDEINFADVENVLEKQIVDAGYFCGNLHIYIFLNSPNFKPNYETLSKLVTSKDYSYLLTAEMEDNSGFVEAIWEDNQGSTITESIYRG